MAPMGKRSFHGKKRKIDERNAQKRPKPKKEKFNLRKASYIKERDAKNEEIEARRRIMEKEKIRQRLEETDSSEEEEVDPWMLYISKLSGYKHTNLIEKLRKSVVTSSESENEDSDAQNENETDKKEKTKEIKKIKRKNVEEKSEESEANEESSDQDEEIIVRMKEDDYEDAETAQEDIGHLRDPFSLHLRNDMDDELYKVVSATPQITKTTTLSWPTLGNLVCQIPKPDSSNKAVKVKKLLDDEEKKYTNYGNIPTLIENVDWNKLHVKSQIQNNLVKANYENIKATIEKDSVPLTPLQRELFSIINNYQDLHYPGRTFSNADEIRFVYCLHVINHVLKTRTKILHHSAKLAKANRSGMGEVPDEYKDQGLVRPKVLIIVPFKHSCLKIVEMFISILFGEDKGGSVINKLRFMDDFTGNELAMSKKNPKPEDYKLSLQGNLDDKFKIGMALTKKTLKLYTNFYSSDIIIGSPLGLRRVVGAEGETVRDYDFLSSIELLIMDQIDIVLMQNWDHLYQVLDYMHLTLKKSHDIDYPRIRSWCGNGWTKYYRQTLIFSSIETPYINTMLIKKCFNYAGQVKVANALEPGSIHDVTIKVPQVFYRFDASDLCQAIDSRLDFFLKEILPRYMDPIYNHTLIYVPCYFDFVYLRNRMMKEKMSFTMISEYTQDRKVARARDMFFHSDAHFLLYTERWHFWRRTRIKGIRHLIFYQLPTYPHFYSEMCNLMNNLYQNPRSGTEYNMSVTVIYNKFDAISLAQIVGQNRATKMIESDSKVHTIKC
ncbi:PREDICTED: digestive organ expansion factor homolog [Cyphomyrmex costatus]|uniref:U3 small nucleolar RNA-associated protein 25 homolog n=1 Tax=Cyphomyrmex costatus TaxID=456900 RepID=A0A195C6H2_9HYME|nr:PREDICTED: digestive organ expansion factor homolog [Cyphomyrmex costatus]XP_018402289.1 PREDICTED: digestive organ expansion factor homolog [Cyphomyrmex costatus]XP_018402290.1 PREDICTED: digestive organ expansion factor homolog [Cyphomyrmex costatus]KYM96464.1 Digestive organ expansion factor like protein [Cyphomyrmex costatus]